MEEARKLKEKKGNIWRSEETKWDVSRENERKQEMKRVATKG